MLTEVREEQPSNASFPIEITLFGIETEVREEQPLNVLSSINIMPTWNAHPPIEME